MVGVAQRMLDGAAVVDTAVVAVLKRVAVLETLHTIKWGEGVSAGAVAIEAADAADYDGQWHLVETVTFAGEAPKQDVVCVQGPYPVLRHRITTPLNDGGTVTSRIDGAE